MTTWRLVSNIDLAIGDTVALEMRDDDTMLSGVIKEMKTEERRGRFSLRRRSWQLVYIGGDNWYDAPMDGSTWRVDYAS